MPEAQYAPVPGSTPSDDTARRVSAPCLLTTLCCLTAVLLLPLAIERAEVVDVARSGAPSEAPRSEAQPALTSTHTFTRHHPKQSSPPPPAASPPPPAASSPLAPPGPSGQWACLELGNFECPGRDELRGSGCQVRCAGTPGCQRGHQMCARHASCEAVNLNDEGTWATLKRKVPRGGGRADGSMPWCPPALKPRQLDGCKSRKGLCAVLAPFVR